MMQDYQKELIAIKDLLKRNPNGMSVTDISKALKKNKNTIGRYLDILLISGQVDMRAYGMAKVYTITQRVPLSAMLSYSKELIMVLDNESRIIDTNDHFLHLLQLSREDTLGKNISHLQSPEVDVHELLDTITTNWGEQESTVTFHVKDKGERIFHQKYVPTVFEDGRNGITLILEDVTEHILAEREIRESEERFRMMADNIRDGLIIMEKGKTIYANNRIAEITGYSHDEMWAMDPLTIIAPESHEKAAEQIQDFEAHPDKPGDLQIWIIRKDKERRFVYARISGVRHHDTYYNFIILTDMTELKTQGSRVRESEQRFRTMADNIQDGLIIVENDKIVFSNRRIKEITGYSADEMAEMGLHGTLLAQHEKAAADSGIVPVTDMNRIEEIFRSVKPDSPTPGEFKIWLPRKDGMHRYIHGKITAAKNGNIISSYITISDITDFAEREKILRERIDALQDLVH
ncbi:MAG: PAS domain-containing protein [Methanoregula sp.]|jgi:PAS domain S-box-containing protein|uniref:PAS domain-containing protein n=1 Tax=Methanoregula sp. TaxID=2052170 RepID=UPI003D0DFF22